MLTLIQSMKDSPYSDRWCILMDAKPKVFYWWDLILDGDEIDKADVVNALRKIESRLKNTNAIDSNILD